jgi:hypothetical protein
MNVCVLLTVAVAMLRNVGPYISIYVFAFYHLLLRDIQTKGVIFVVCIL